MTSILFLGDICLNNKYIYLSENNIDPFLEIKDVLSQSDYLVGNLECTVKGDQGENLLKFPRVSTTLTALNYLKKIGVNLVSLANNHSYDNLKDGFVKTTAFLNNNEIDYVGAHTDNALSQTPIIKNIDNKKKRIIIDNLTNSN